MRIFLFFFTLFAGIGLVGPTAKEAAAQCTHLGQQGACPLNIPNGSNSVSFNADGTINWSNGGVSGPCCAQPSGTETGGGLLNLNNQLGGNRFHFGPTVTPTNPETNPFAGEGIIDIVGGDFLDLNGEPVCNFGSCSGDGLLGQVFGASPNSGYLCDSGGPGCGNDLWVSTPQPGFGSCGPGGCTGSAPIVPLDTSNLPRTGAFAANLTTGDIDPFASGSYFMDPQTGEPTELPENRDDWPDRVKLAQELRDAHDNGEIGYPFGDPNWDKRSVQYYKDNPIQAPVTPAGQSLTDRYHSFGFYQSAENRRRDSIVTTLPQIFVTPYQQNRTTGDIDPFGGAGNFFQDPRTGKTTELPEKTADWPEKFKKAEKLNGLYVSGHIKYPFNDPDWETKPASAFSTKAGTGTPDSPSLIVRSGRRGLGIGSDTTPSSSLLTTGQRASRQFGTSIIDDRIPVHRVQSGESLFRLALRYGVTAEAIAQANGISSDTPLTAGQVVTIPTSTPVPPSVASDNTPQTEEPKSEATQSGVRGGKAGRFGIGADTSLGGVGGLSARFQVAKNFGVQAIVSFTRVGLDSKNPNADLTNYVSAAVSNLAPPTTPPQVTTQPPKPTVTNLQPETFGAAGPTPQIDQLDREGGETTYRVMFQGQIGPTGDPRTAEFDSRAAANRFTNMMKFEGMSFEDAAAAMPDDMKPTLGGTPATDLTETLTTRVPKEFQAPILTDRWDGEIHDIIVTNPRTNDQRYFKTREHAEIFLGALRGGASWSEAQQIDLEATRVARNNGVVATSPDGLASATVRGGGRTPTGSTPAPAGSAPTVINTRPAIIVNTPPDSTPGQAVVTNTPPPGQAVVTNNPPPGRAVVTAITPPPTRPEGQSAGFMTAGLQGQAYRVEIIKTPDGRSLAVGTGENANHVFGEVKETTVKIFGDWRREGPWTPPPPPAGTGSGGTTDNAAANTTPPEPTRTLSNLSPAQVSNAQIRSQIANSDRDHMTQQIFADGFESGDTTQWTFTTP